MRTKTVSLLFVIIYLVPDSVGFPSGSEVNSPVNAGDARDSGSILGSGDLLEEEMANPLQYSCLNNPPDRAAWQVAVLGVPKRVVRDFETGHTHMYPMWCQGQH